jgi:rhodanese-related sulfurtransferase
MAHYHSPRFLALIEAARRNVREMTIEEYRERVASGEPLVLVDVREDREWEAGRMPDAIHLGKGVIERDIEDKIPDRDTPIVCQCAGGYRSVLVCENLQKMGYTNTWSLAEGYRGWVKRGLPVEPPEP